MQEKRKCVDIKKKKKKRFPPVELSVFPQSFLQGVAVTEKKYHQSLVQIKFCG